MGEVPLAAIRTLRGNRSKQSCFCLTFHSAASHSQRICDKQNARSGLLERATERLVENRRLTLYFSGLILLRLFFLFLELEFVADELEDGHLGVVADAVAGVNDAGGAAGAVREFRRDLAQYLLGDGRQDEV